MGEDPICSPGPWTWFPKHAYTYSHASPTFPVGTHRGSPEHTYGASTSAGLMDACRPLHIYKVLALPLTQLLNAQEPQGCALSLKQRQRGRQSPRRQEQKHSFLKKPGGASLLMTGCPAHTADWEKAEKLRQKETEGSTQASLPGAQKQPSQRAEERPGRGNHQRETGF